MHSNWTAVNRNGNLLLIAIVVDTHFRMHKHTRTFDLRWKLLLTIRAHLDEMGANFIWKNGKIIDSGTATNVVRERNATDTYLFADVTGYLIYFE